ncbi:hypothetical protein WJX77_009399 [Trebouxia sp. C0004]
MKEKQGTALKRQARAASKDTVCEYAYSDAYPLFSSLFPVLSRASVRTVQVCVTKSFCLYPGIANDRKMGRSYHSFFTPALPEELKSFRIRFQRTHHWWQTPKPDAPCQQLDVDSLPGHPVEVTFKGTADILFEQYTNKHHSN